MTSTKIYINVNWKKNICYRYTVLPLPVPEYFMVDFEEGIEVQCVQRIFAKSTGKSERKQIKSQKTKQMMKGKNSLQVL